MIRTTAILALALAICASARAQVIIRTGRPVVSLPQPAGVIQSPMLPLPGSPLQHMTTAPAIPRPFIQANPYNFLGRYSYAGYGFGGYAPIYPGSGYYETTPTVVNNYIPVPTPVATPAYQPPAELKARLTLNVPSGAQVLLAGKEVDTAVTPLILESPVLRSGQAYTFDVKVSWPEGRKKEERARKVTVDAGETKSLTYLESR